jgi:acyl carrier protein
MVSPRLPLVFGPLSPKASDHPRGKQLALRTRNQQLTRPQPCLPWGSRAGRLRGWLLSVTRHLCCAGGQASRGTNNMTDSITSAIREFIVSNFMYGQDAATLGDGESFLDSGIIDSTGVLELVAFIEERFNVQVGDRELLPENLDSVQNVTRFVSTKLAAQAQSGDIAFA